MRTSQVMFPSYMHGPGYAQAPADRISGRFVQQTFFFLALHAPLGFAIKASPWLATAHAVATALIAFAHVSEARSPARLLPALAYVAASESLWRVGKAMIFYESAKYLLAALSILALARIGNLGKTTKMPIVYFALLVPSILVMPLFDRQDISFNLSGPFSLAVASFVLSRVSVTGQVLRKIFTALMGPIVALATVATFSTVTTEHIDFYQTKIASGGLGPNQASSLLGLGALIAFLYVSLLRRHKILTSAFALLGLWGAAQGALTFSRGGIATAAGGAAAATFFLSLDRRFRGRAVIRVVLVLVVAAFFVIPVLSTITRGAVEDRFSNSSLTGRDKIIKADFIVFWENPILGVGPGQSYDYHALTFRASSPHTEYSRLLSEHGMLGALALLLLFAMSWRWVMQQEDARAKAFSAALVTWALLYMFHAAMRMAIVSFVFALASTKFTNNIPRVADKYAHRFRSRPPV